jgi:non-ribosomal peptide synthetase component E (peptide arylation enzyme)
MRGKMRPFLMTEEKKERYTKAGYWGLPTLHEVFEEQVLRYSEKEMLVDSTGKRLTFSRAKKCVDRLALGFLELGFKKDDVLVVQLPNVVEAPLLRLAVPKSGILGLFIMIAFGTNEVKHCLSWTEARGIVIPWKFRDRDYFKMVQEMRSDLPKLEYIFIVGDEIPKGCVSIKEMMEHPIEEEYPPDYLEGKGISTWEVQELQTTTGTTGLPKITEAYGWNQLQGYPMGERLKVTEDDILGFAIPFPAGVSNCFWCVGIIKGCKMALLERFDTEEALKFVEREKITMLVIVPAIAEMLVRVQNLNQYQIDSLRIIYTGGAPMPSSLAKEVEEKMHCKVVGVIGSMDFGPISLPLVDDPPEVRHNSLGKPLPGIEIKIINDKGEEVPEGEVGELICRGPYSYTGYFKMPEATLEAVGGDKDGWFKTGDLVKIGKDGNIYIVGRLKDIIKRGGMTISAVEIENFLRTHPKLENVVIVPMPDPLLGEKVCAFVIPKPGEEFTFEEMISFLKEKKLATFKLPERLEIENQFPMVGGMKILKRELTEKVTEKLKAEGKI